MRVARCVVGVKSSLKTESNPGPDKKLTSRTPIIYSSSGLTDRRKRPPRSLHSARRTTHGRNFRPHPPVAPASPPEPRAFGKEEETARFIKQILTGYGIETQTGIGGHGLCARINRQAEGPTLAFRADFDALPLPDLKTTDYASAGQGSCMPAPTTPIAPSSSAWQQR